MRKSLTSAMMDISVEGTKLPYLQNCETYYHVNFPVDLWFYAKFMQMAFNEYHKGRYLCSFADFMEMEYPSKKKKRQ